MKGRIQSAIVVFILIFIFGDAFGNYIIGGVYRYIFSMIIFVLIAVYLLSYNIKINKLDKFPIRVAFISLFLLLISLPFWSSTHNIYSYFGIIVSLFVYQLNFKLLNTLLVYILFICFILGIYEYFTQKYLFINTSGEIMLDEKLMGGMTGVFRSKAIFYGPLTLGVFASQVYLLNNKKILILIFSVIISFFANSRLGMLLLMPSLCWLMMKSQTSFKYIILFILVLGAIYYFIPSSYFEISINRILDVNTKGSQDARIYFWTEGINQYLNYPIKHLIFGNNGLFTSIHQNNPESGWICLLTDNGIIGFMFYFIPLGYCLMKFFERQDFFYLMITVTFITLNSLVTYHLGGPGNLLYWLITFELFNKAKFGVNKLELSIVNLKS